MQIDITPPFTATGTGLVVELHEALAKTDGPVVIRCGPGARLLLERAVMSPTAGAPPIEFTGDVKPTGELLSAYYFRKHEGDTSTRIEVVADESVPHEVVRIASLEAA